MLKTSLLFCLVTITFAIEGVINPASTDELDAALRSKIDQIAADLEDLVELLNRDLDGKLFYRPDSRLEYTSNALEDLVLELDEIDDNDDDNVEVEIIEITEVEPDDDETDEEIEEIIEEEEEGTTENSLATVDELTGRNNNHTTTIHDSKTKKHAEKKKTQLKADKKKKLSAKEKEKKMKKKLSAAKKAAEKEKDKKKKLTTKIIKKTKLSPSSGKGSKKKKLSAKDKFSFKEAKNMMSRLNNKDAQNICSAFVSSSSKSLKTKSTSLRGLDGEQPSKPNVATTIQQLTEAFNKLQSAILQASRGNNLATPPPSMPQPSGSSGVSGVELGPGVGNGEQSTISPQVASNIANVLHRMAAVTASTTSNPLDPIVKAAISVQGQAANALRGILPSQRV